MASALLTYGDYNVIIVGWRRGAEFPYSQATADARLVGLEVANLVNKLVVIFCFNFIKN
jgi:Lipase